MGVNFTAVVLITFAIGSALAAYAGIMNGLYYNEINFGMGLYLGVIGFAAAIIGGSVVNLFSLCSGLLFASIHTLTARARASPCSPNGTFILSARLELCFERPISCDRRK